MKILTKQTTFCGVCCISPIFLLNSKDDNNIRIFNGREVRIENSVTRVTVKPRDAEQLSRVTEYQFEPNNHYRFFFLHILLSTIASSLDRLYSDT